MKFRVRSKVDAIRLETQNNAEVLEFCDGRPLYILDEFIGIQFRPSTKSNEDDLLRLGEWVVKLGDYIMIFDEEQFNNQFRITIF